MPNNGFQPFPIFDWKSGLVLERDAWLLPRDAFARLKNAHLKKGVLEKRKGSVALGRIVHTKTTSVAAPVDSNPDNPVMMLKQTQIGGDNYLLAADTKRINEWDPTTSAFVDQTRRMIHVKPGAVPANTQDHSPVVGDVCTGATSGTTAVIESIVLDHGALGLAGAGDFWLLFTKAAFGVAAAFTDGETLTDATGGAGHRFGVADGADSDYEFPLDPTGSAIDYYAFFWMLNWNNVSYIGSRKATCRVYKYKLDDASSNRRLTPLQIDLDVEAGPDNDLLGARAALLFRGSILLFGTVEKSVSYPRRMRWCSGDNPQSWPALNFVDCDSGDEIMGAVMLGQTPIVFFQNSIWKVRYTGLPTEPFEWENISTLRGCAAPSSPAELPVSIPTAIAMGPTGLVGANTREAQDMAPQIRDFPMSFNLSLIGYDYSLVRQEDRQFWMTYAESNQTAPNAILIGSYDEQNWATYALAAHVLGLWEVDSELLLDSIEDVLDTLDYSFDDEDIAAGYPLTMLGTIDGYVRQANSGGTDVGTAIEMDILSGKWNPFIEQGRKAWLGWVDIYADADEDISFSVGFYVDDYGSAHTTKTVTLDGGPIGGKIRKRVFVNPVQGEFHQIRLYHTASNQRPRIHAITPFFKIGASLLK